MPGLYATESFFATGLDSLSARSLQLAAVKLWSHQQDGHDWAWARPAALLHHGMGSGKTRTALSIIVRSFAEEQRKRCLVCCPKAVIAAWVKQVGLWCPETKIFAVDQQDRKKKIKAIEEALRCQEPCIVVCNYESAWRLSQLEKAPWDILVWDEVHRLKAPGGAASRWAAKMCKKNEKARKLGLSGTLIPHSILDAWAIYRSVEAPYCPTFGDTFTVHRANYAIMNPRQQGMVIGWRNLDDAHRRIDATTHRIRSEDVLDLPEIQFLDVTSELYDDEATLYREIEDEFCVAVDAGTVTPTNALEQMLRLQQICGGHVRWDDTAEAVPISEGHASKAARLRDMMEDLPESEPIVVFCKFRPDLAAARWAAESLGRKVLEQSGERRELAAWQAGEAPVLVVQVQSGGEGIDLTRACYCVFYSLSHSLATYDQGVARVHRPGQMKRTFIYHLVATNKGKKTIDGRIYDALRNRRAVVETIIDGIRSGERP